MEILKVMSRLARPETQYLPYSVFPLVSGAWSVSGGWRGERSVVGFEIDGNCHEGKRRGTEGEESSSVAHELAG